MSTPEITSHPEISSEKAKALETIAEASGLKGRTGDDVAAAIQKIKQERAGMPAAAEQTMKGHENVGVQIVDDLDMIAYKKGVIPDDIKQAVAKAVEGSGMSPDKAIALVTKFEAAEAEIKSSFHSFGRSDRKPLVEGEKLIQEAGDELSAAVRRAFDSDVTQHLDLQDAKSGHSVTPLGSGAKSNGSEVAQKH